MAMRTTSSGIGDDQIALEGEHHQDGEEQGDQGDRADLGDEGLVIPLLAFDPRQDHVGEEAGDEGDAQVDEDGFGNLADGDVHRHALQSKPGGQHRDKDIGIHAVEQHLEDAVEGHQPGGILGITFGQLVPHDHHGDAARQADHDQPSHVFGIVVQEDDRQHEHQDGADDPVLQQRQAQHLPVAENLAQLVIMHFGQRRVHHQDQADGDGDVGGANRNGLVKCLRRLGGEIAQTHTPTAIARKIHRVR